MFFGGLKISLVIFGYITEFEKKRYITKQQDGEVFDPRTQPAVQNDLQGMYLIFSQGLDTCSGVSEYMWQAGRYIRSVFFILLINSSK